MRSLVTVLFAAALVAPAPAFACGMVFREKTVNLADLMDRQLALLNNPLTNEGLPPNLVICNSGLTESGYSFGRALKDTRHFPSATGGVALA